MGTGCGSIESARWGTACTAALRLRQVAVSLRGGHLKRACAREPGSCIISASERTRAFWHGGRDLRWPPTWSFLWEAMNWAVAGDGKVTFRASPVHRVDAALQDCRRQPRMGSGSSAILCRLVLRQIRRFAPAEFGNWLTIVQIAFAGACGAHPDRAGSGPPNRERGEGRQCRKSDPAGRSCEPAFTSLQPNFRPPNSVISDVRTSRVRGAHIFEPDRSGSAVFPVSS